MNNVITNNETKIISELTIGDFTNFDNTLISSSIISEIESDISTDYLVLNFKNRVGTASVQSSIKINIINENALKDLYEMFLTHYTNYKNENRNK